MRIGFIGLGNIGLPMARHLTGQDFELLVYDAIDAPVEELVRLGARAATPATIANECKLVGICVRDAGDVEQLLHRDGLLAAAMPDTIVAIHSTVPRHQLLRWSAEAARHDAHLIDAPITGGAHGAEAGELVFMVGCEPFLFERCEPVFDLAAKDVVHTGDVGTGIALKLCVNMMTYAAFIAIKESTELARASGLDPEVLYRVGRGNGMVSDFNHRFISNRDALLSSCDDETLSTLFAPFGALAEKDLDAALASADELGLELPNVRNSRRLIRDTFLKR